MIVIAALTLLLLAGAISWQAFSEHKPDTKITLEDVEEIRIERVGHPEMVLHGEDEVWRIAQPWSLPANRQRIEPLLSALAMGGNGYAPDEMDMEATGLANPEVTLQIDDIRIEIGAPDVDGTRRYARRDGRIVLIDDWVASLIDGGVTAMARLTPFDESLKDVQASMMEPATDQDRLATKATNSMPGSTMARSGEPYANLTPDDWQSLSARQIVAWPIEDAAAVQAQASLRATTGSGGSRGYELIQTVRYTALHPLGTGFAYVFANEDWPCAQSPSSDSRKSRSVDAGASTGC